MARKKTRKKSRQPRAKPVKLDPEVWLRGSKAISQYRASELIEQDYLCGISSLPLTADNSVADHLHFGGMCPDQIEGKLRGILLSEINLMEGKFLRTFKKSKVNEKYGLTFPELLISMGLYLQKDNSEKPYHFEVMTTLRNHIKRLTKEQIVSKIQTEFKLEACKTEPKVELVRRYVQAFVELVEHNEYNRRKIC